MGPPAPTPDFARDLLIDASGPDPASASDRVCTRILERARHLAAADGGGIVFHGPGAALGEADVVHVEAAGRAETERLARTWCNDPEGPAALAWRRAEAVHRTAPDAALPAAALRGLWLPLVEGRRMVHGVLHLAAGGTEAFPDRTLDALAELAAAALPALFRLALRRRLAAAGRDHAIVGVSERFLQLERLVRRIGAGSDGPVLILGERGSGKELVASAIHAWSRRRSHPFVPVLASTFSEGLVADELFGHERHSFTGAHARRLGRFGAADGGTLFLDEVADLPPRVQASLMRIIDKGELTRVGSDLPVPVDVRVVTATNRDLAEMMEQREFRRDLYDRLGVLEVHVPPLRERAEDIPLLAGAFLRAGCPDVRRHALGVHGAGCAASACGPQAPCTGRGFLDHLVLHDWPGNVRELKNVIHSLVALAPEDVLQASHLPARLQRPALDAGASPPAGPEAADLHLDTALRRHIERVLVVADDNQSRAADLLGLPLSTLRHKMKRLGMTMPDGRRAGRRRPAG